MSITVYIVIDVRFHCIVEVETDASAGGDLDLSITSER